MSVADLMRAVKNRKCVVWFTGKPMPAAFLVNMSFGRVIQFLPLLKLYKPKKI